MFENNQKIKITFVEILAILLFIVAIVFIFNSRTSREDDEKQIRNAVRYQDVTLLADAFWKMSITSTEYSNIISEYEKTDVCNMDSVDVVTFSDVLIPDYLETIPMDPHGESYKVGFNTNDTVTICSPWGEDSENNYKLISITR